MRQNASRIQQLIVMQEWSSRTKEGLGGSHGTEINIQKYGQQLKSELFEISKLIARKHRPKKQQDTPNLLKRTPLQTQRPPSSSKNTSLKLEQSAMRGSNEREHQNRRNLIYDTQACKDEQPLPEPLPQLQLGTLYGKSPYSQTMSTASSHSKTKRDRPEGGMVIGDFALGKKLGEGKFGEVFVARHHASGFVCALKRIERTKLDQKLVTQLCRQIKIQSFLNHPNIVKLYGFFSDEKCVYLLQELCCSGQLYTLLKRKRRIPQELTRIILQQICRAMDYMHECEIIHRDLKPENIIYHNGLIKICDFGWSISSKTMRQTFCGTPLYVSPELLKRKNYNNKIDVWSIGVLTYELLFGRVPFEIVSERDFVKVIEDEIKFSKGAGVSEEAKDFISVCLKKDPRDRYTLPELLEHPFIAVIENPVLAELY